MINDPLMPTSSAERLAALRTVAPNRRRPAYNSKIMTAGLSTTAMLGMIAGMGWSSVTSAQAVAQLVPVTDGLSPIDTTGVTAPVTAPPAAAIVVTTAPPATTTPPTLVPVTVAPLIAAPVDTAPIDTTPPTDPVVTEVVVPQAVPAPKPVVKNKKKRVTAPAPITQPSG
jgi:hypothetical protein